MLVNFHMLFLISFILLCIFDMEQISVLCNLNKPQNFAETSLSPFSCLKYLRRTFFTKFMPTNGFTQPFVGTISFWSLYHGTAALMISIGLGLSLFKKIPPLCLNKFGEMWYTKLVEGLVYHTSTGIAFAIRCCKGFRFMLP